MHQRLALPLLAAVVALPLIAAPTARAGVHFLPAAQHEQVGGPQSSRALLTWRLPDGVLVVDRREHDSWRDDDRELTPRYDGGEYFLVGDRPGARHDHDHVDLAAFGHVHLRSGDRAVVEVAPASLDGFLEAGLCVQYLDRSSLAPTPEAGRNDAATAAHAVRDVDPAVKTAYLDALDQQQYDQVLREISGDLAFWHEGGPHVVDTRYYSTFGNDLVTEYLSQILASWGYQVELDTFTAWGATCRNVVATLPGTTAPDEYVVVGGHFDSTSPDASDLAPGAEDNASGTSLVMELARVSSGRQFDRSVQFVLFDAEEIGLRGSQHFVDEAVAAGRDIVAAITADMVSYFDRSYGVIIEGQTDWEWLMTAMADNVTAHTDIMHEKTYHSWGSDHVPFQQAGIAAFLAIDMDWSEYPHYHQISDTWDQIAATSNLGLEIARAAAGTLADVAGLRDDTTPVVTTPTATPIALDAAPNPFNPRVRLSFAVAAPTSGELAVFDVSGRRIATLASGVFLGGEHVVTWDGADATGRAQPSGVYLARLVTDAGTAGRKLHLVR